MGETRSRTTLDIRVNARQVNELERQLQRVFSPRALMDFDRSIRGLTRSIMDLNRTAAAGQASDRRWRDMAEDLRKAREEAAELTRQIKELQNRQRELGGGAGGAAAGGAAGGFAGGAAAGGQQSRARTGIGQGVPGGQVPMPGVGAMATAMSALPWVGLLFAGSLMAAAGTYQSHLGYQQASMGSAAFLGRSGGALGLSSRVAGLTAANQRASVTDLAPSIRQARADIGMYRRQSAVQQEYLAGERAGGGNQSLLDAATDLGLLDDTELLPGFTLGDAVRAKRGADKGSTSRDLAVLARAGSGPYPHSAKNLRTANQRLDDLSRQQQAAYSSAGARAFQQATGEWFSPSAYATAGARFGVKPQQALQEAGQMSRAAVRPLSSQEYEFGLSARTMFGIDLATTGALMGQMEYAGTSSMQSGNRVAQMIGSAVARGLESSEIATYLQRSNQFLQEQVNQGRQVDMAGIVRMEERLTGTGIAGWRSGTITQQFAGAGAQIGMQGPQSAVEFRLMEAMGFTGKGGFEEYARFRLQMQDPGRVAAAMPSFVSHINRRTAGMGESSRALILQQYFSRIRTMLGPQEAARLVQGMAAGGLDMGSLGMDQFIESGATAARGLGSSLIAEAGLERERVGIGAGIAPTMQNLAGTVNNLAARFTNIAGPVLGKLTEALDKATQKLEDYTFEFGQQPEVARR